MRILVIDDQTQVRAAVSLALRAKGFDVVTAENGQAGLRAFKASRFDLVIADIFMPEMDGVKLIKALRERNPDLPPEVTYLEVEQGTKGGRLRHVPIDTPEKRAALEEARRLVTVKTGHLGRPGKSLAQNMSRFSYVMGKFGITREMLGVTSHGLRHEYGNDRYEQCSGEPSPVRGGGKIDRKRDKAARLKVVKELGHSREAVGRAYLGPILRGKPATASPEASSPDQEEPGAFLPASSPPNQGRG